MTKLLPLGQRVRVNSLEFLFVRRLVGTITGHPTNTSPFYRVAIDARFGGDTISARHIELEPLLTTPAEVATPRRLPDLPWITARETINA